MLNIYKLYKEPKTLYLYKEADIFLVQVFWEKYKNNPEELKKREKYIAKDAYYSYLYARDIIRGVFPLGEAEIMKHTSFTHRYILDILYKQFNKEELNLYWKNLLLKYKEIKCI